MLGNEANELNLWCSILGVRYSVYIQLIAELVARDRHNKLNMSLLAHWMMFNLAQLPNF